MIPSVRCLTTLGLLSALVVASRADDVQHLPAMSVYGSPGLNPLQPSVVTLPTAGDPSSGLADAARYTAGFSINDAGARGFGQTTTLRGLGNTPFFSDSSSPVYLDDIPLVSAVTFPSDLYDFTHLVIYRGPQAASLFGRAGDAGVIQLLSEAPPTGTHGRLTFGAGNYGLFNYGASISSTSGEKSDITASIGGSERDGYIHNTQINQDVDTRESLTGRVKWRYRPADGLELSLHVLGQRARDGAQALVPMGGPLYEVQRGKEGSSDSDFAAAAFGVSKKLSDGTLTSTTSFSKWELSPYDNRLVVFGGADFDSAMSQSQRTFTEELRYVSDLFSGGAFYSTSRTRGSTDRIFSGFPVERSGFTTDVDAMAIYGRAHLSLAEGWVLTPGIRAELTSKEFQRVETIPGSQVYNRDNDWWAFVPSLTLTRRFDPTMDASLTLARGFKPGGYSAYTGFANLTKFDPQRTWGLEGSFTKSLRDNRLSLTARAYAYRVKGYQIERSFAVPDTATDEYLVVNADRARVLGLELETVWRPLRDLTVTLAASASRATLQDFTDPFTGASYSGNQAPYAPAGNGALRIEYRPETGTFAGVGVTWTGTTYYDEQETDFLSQRSYALYDAHLGFAFARGDVRLFGRNLGDKEYYSSITAGVGHATPGAPLTWGGELNLRW